MPIIIPVSPLKIANDVLCASVLFTMWALVKHVLAPVPSGLFCDDYSVNLPYKESTVSNSSLVVMVLVVPNMIIIATELVRTLYRRRVLTQPSFDRLYYQVSWQRRVIHVPEELGNVYVNCGAHFFGIVITNLVTNICKMAMGRLRPNFLDVCKPDRLPYALCNVTEGVTYLRVGVDFHCTQTDASRVVESRLSFPSGHASLSFFSCVFLVLFVRRAWTCRSFGLVPYFVQAWLLIVAAFTGISRVTDNKHHASDVLVGSALGTVVGALSFVWLTDYASKRELKRAQAAARRESYDMVAMDECVVTGEGTTNDGFIRVKSGASLATGASLVTAAAAADRLNNNTTMICLNEQQLRPSNKNNNNIS